MKQTMTVDQWNFMTFSSKATLLEFDPAGFVLTGYGRINGGTARGDTSTVTRFRNLFFAV